MFQRSIRLYLRSLEAASPPISNRPTVELCLARDGQASLQGACLRNWIPAFALCLCLTGCGLSTGTPSSNPPNDPPSGNGAAMYVLFPPGSKSPNFPDMQQYLMSNSIVAGANFSVNWSDVDQGPGASPQYVWDTIDSRLQPWIAAGKKVNLIVWPVSYGSPNAATPAYVMNNLGSSNTVSCNGETIPNYFNSAFLQPYEAFIAQVVQHYANNSSVGYIRFGLGQGGEIYPVYGMQKDATCNNAFLSWGWSDTSWGNYLDGLLDYEKGLKSPHRLMIGITFIAGVTVENAVVAHAVANGIGFGNQGFQLSDISAYAAGQECQANWCALFDQYAGQVPLQLQTKGQSDPTNAPPTGSLVTLLPFAASRHTTVFEIYWEDWLIAYAPDYPGYSQYHTAYAKVLEDTANGTN